jgi:hypothetical protein
MLCQLQRVKRPVLKVFLASNRVIFVEEVNENGGKEKKIV